MDIDTILRTSPTETLLGFLPVACILALVLYTLLHFRRRNMSGCRKYDFHQETITQVDRHGVTTVIYDHDRRRKQPSSDTTLQHRKTELERAARLAEQHRVLHRRLSKDFGRKYTATWWSEYLPSPREWMMSLPQFGRRWSRSVPDAYSYIIPRNPQQVFNVVQNNNDIVFPDQESHNMSTGHAQQAVQIRMRDNGEVVLTRREPRDAFAGQPKQAISGTPPCSLKASGDPVIERKTRSGKSLGKGPASLSLPRTSKIGNVRARHVFLSKQTNGLVVQ